MRRTMSLTGNYAVETPESIEVNFELAGPGSRFCALLIDSLLMWLVCFAVLIVAACGGLPFWAVMDEAGLGRQLGGWLWAVVLLVIMLVTFGYFALLELLLSGQTPGKRYMQLRVIRDDGTPAMPLDIMIRNLVRLVDALPGVYVVGGLATVLHPQHKRLGDIAAGTMVVREEEADFRAAADRKRAAPPPEAQVTYSALSAAESRLVRGFLMRRVELLPEARLRLAHELAQRLHAHHGGDASEPEAYLERLAEGRHLDA